MKKNKTKGVLLAGGYGSRLYPITKVVSKHLLPVYDKPLIYYSLSNLILCGVFEICIVTQEKNIKIFKELLNEFSNFGIKIIYKTQNVPTGIPDAINLCKNFIGKSDIVLALGDNIFFGHNFEDRLYEAIKNLNDGSSSILTHPVKDPKRFGVATIRSDQIKKLEEKPIKPKSNYAITGLYFLTNNCVERSKKLKKSRRGETEIIDLLKFYLNEKKLKHIYTGRGTFWSDAGTPESLNDASNFPITISLDRTK